MIWCKCDPGKCNGRWPVSKCRNNSPDNPKNKRIQELEARMKKLETVIATHADPTGDDQETIDLIMECVEGLE